MFSKSLFVQKLLVSFFLLSAFVQAQVAENDGLDEKLEGLFQRQQFDDAVTLLTQHLKDSPDDKKRRVGLASLLSYQGKSEDGIELLQEGLRGGDDDKEIYWYLGQAWLARAEDGPNVVRSEGTVTYHPSKMSDEEEEAWKKVEFKKAADAFRKVLAAEPDRVEVAEFLVKALKGGFATKELGDQVGVLAEKFPENLQIGLLHSDVLYEAKDFLKATEALNALLALTPRNEEVYGKLARIYEQQGNELAEEYKAKAKFYQWMPPFAEVEYSPALAKKIELLLGHEKLKETVDGLIAEKTQASNDLMAAVCWHHLAHGPIENSCFEELEKRGEGDLLVSLIKNAQSVCTAREGGKALARMKHPEALPILSRLVAMDQRPFWISNAAEALEILGDEKAVAVLVETAAPAFQENKRQLKKATSDFMSQGPYHNRLRCLLALGSFDTSESKTALKEAAQNPELAMISEFALYRLTRDKQHLAKGFQLAEDENLVRFYVAPYIEQKINDAQSLAALKAWQKEHPDEKEE